MLEGFFLLERHPVRIARQIPQHDQAAEARHEIDGVGVEAVFLNRGTKRVAHPGDDDRGWAFFVAVMQAQRSGRDAHDVQDAIQRLREHFLNFAADEARGGQVQIRKRQHVAFDTTALLFVNGHEHQHAAENFREESEREQVHVRQRPQGVLENQQQTQNSRGDECERQQLVSAGLLLATFFPEDLRREEEEDGDAQPERRRNPFLGVGVGPEGGEERHKNDVAGGNFHARVHPRGTIESEGRCRHHPFVRDINPNGKGSLAAEGVNPKGQRSQHPGNGPDEQVGLALLAVDVGEKHP